MMSSRNWVGHLVLAAGLLGVASGADAADNKVVLYTAHKSSIVQKMIPLFEAETGIKAEVVQLGSGDVFRRARAEAGAPKADVIWSVTGSLLSENADLLSPYTTKEQAAIDERFVASPAWTPYTTVIYVLMVNSRMVKDAEIPKTWAELSDPKWKGKVASARADNSGSAFQQMTTVLTAGGDKGWEVYGKLAKNFIFSDSSGAVPRYVADGEAPLGLTLEDNALEYVAGGAPVKIAYVADGTTTSPDGVALVKGAPNPEPAKRFIDWALSKKTQEALVKEAGRRSVRKDVAAPGEVKPLAELTLVKLKSVEELGGTKAMIEKWRQATGQ
ncbi:putative 2-aminoethylphosphonate ABC transporter, periplasmic binding protein precursor [Bosea sp. LC85]|uniref:extracellular solute-binding protein n=1 Tax=Bosea sp. LC85 TaxID=1502851 RepID=UPI0004E35492|nr:extracellular solute-binding protein [Bosea sp. LC85]KFC74841.1 putative 2-aminoethylphosphonate ABC transporter, periplasmic binding protein precursor [Bosea sp. LC85]